MSKTKYDAIRIAKQLQYSEDTLQAIANAKNGKRNFTHNA